MPTSYVAVNGEQSSHKWRKGQNIVFAVNTENTMNRACGKW